MKRALILCPGRGSYGRDALGSLNDLLSPALDVLDAHRQKLERPTAREMDAAPKYQSKLHVRGENASILTAGVSVADIDQINDSIYETVAVIGNSMGWYTALGVAGALHMKDCADLIETMGQYQSNNIVGGQIVYPMVNGDWQIDPDQAATVQKITDTIPDLYWSIRLGGQAVLGGTEEALKAAIEQLPPLTQGAHTFPIRLPLHSAFHTPLMEPTSQRAIEDLQTLNWSSPKIPMIDGSGTVWPAKYSSGAAIRDYTLTHQVTDTFDLTLCIRTALRTSAPDVVILPGPGSNLGSAVAQVLIQEGWAGIHNRDDFIKRQNSDPILLSMRWPDQRKIVIGK
ncbi:MAG: malonyl CoA-ACP transacylase [Myxococcota bacterium]